MALIDNNHRLEWGIISVYNTLITGVTNKTYLWVILFPSWQALLLCDVDRIKKVTGLYGIKKWCVCLMQTAKTTTIATATTTPTIAIAKQPHHQHPQASLKASALTRAKGVISQQTHQAERTLSENPNFLVGLFLIKSISSPANSSIHFNWLLFSIVFQKTLSVTQGSIA